MDFVEQPILDTNNCREELELRCAERLDVEQHTHILEHSMQPGMLWRGELPAHPP